MANQDENGQTFCPKCQSKNRSCWDEQVEWFFDPDADPSEYEVEDAPGYKEWYGTEYDG